MASNFTNPNEMENNQQNQQEQQGQQAPATQPVQSLAGSSQISSSPSSRVASFSTGQAGTPGSGRFTNLKNYLDANKNATAQFGQRANTQLNQAFSKESDQLNKANQGLQSAFQQGRSTLDTGDLFKTELQKINEKLTPGFDNFGERNSNFDEGSQAAVNFFKSGLNKPTVSVQPVVANPDEEDPAPNIPGLQLGRGPTIPESDKRVTSGWAELQENYRKRKEEERLGTSPSTGKLNKTVPEIDPTKTFESYLNIAQGQGLDEKRLQNIQDSTSRRASDLAGFANKQLQNVETETGRTDLFNRLVKPKEGYTQGQESLDKLFFGGALGDVRSNLQNRQSEALATRAGIDAQGNLVSELANRESDLVKALREQSQGAQQAFSDALYGEDTLQRNIEQLNAARDEKYNNLVENLRNGGTISREDADMLGLSGLNTYANKNIINPPAGTKLTPIEQRELVSIFNNLKNEGDINKYISKGRQANNAQDITSQEDFETYKALQNIALGRDLGNVSNVSELGKVIQAGTKGSLTALGQDVTNSDFSFNKDIQDNKFGSTAAARGGSSPIGGNRYTSNISSQQAVDLQNQLLRRGVNLDSSTDVNRYLTGTGLVGQGYNRVFDALRGVYIPNYDLLSQISSTNLPGTVDKDDFYSIPGEEKLESRLRVLVDSINKLDPTGYKNSLGISDNVAPTNKFRGLL